MNHHQNKWSVLLLMLGMTVQAQQATTAAGGDASGSGGTVAFSVGQVVYTANTGTSGTISQGVQQAYTMSIVAIHETDVNISLSVFPNPTDGNLTLHVSGLNDEAMSYQLLACRADC